MIWVEDDQLVSDRELVKCHVCGTSVGDIYDGSDPDTAADIASGDLSPTCDDCDDKDSAAAGFCRKCSGNQPPRDIVDTSHESPYCAACQAKRSRRTLLGNPA